MYTIQYDELGKPYAVRRENNHISLGVSSPELIDFFSWNEQQQTPLDYQSEVTPPNNEIQSLIYTLPIVAPDFIVATPPIHPDPEQALLEAIAEMEKGEGNPKSIALIALSLAKYLKSKKDKLK